MGRITSNDSQHLSNYISQQTRVEILYRYLVQGHDQTRIANDVLNNYDKMASMSVSVVTRGFGFYNGRGRGKYPSVSKNVILEFVRIYSPENVEGGLDEGTFDEFLKSYYNRERASRASRSPAPQTRPRVQHSAYDEDELYDVSSQGGNSTGSFGDGLPPLLMILAGILGLVLIFFVGKFLLKVALGVGAVVKTLGFVKLVVFIFCILITKPMLKAKNTGFNLGGRIFILAVIWLATSYFLIKC